MFSDFFIRRPIFATVIAIIMVIAGLLCVTSLPIAQYPNLTPPTVSVSASYPGADATTVAQTVGIPIEENVNGVEGMLYMSSNSGADGQYSLTVTFENDVNLDEAAVEIQNRISEATLPSEVTQQGISVNKEATSQVLFCALEGSAESGYDALALTNYAKLNILDPLSRVEGVGGVQSFGAGEYSMRIWLNPQIMQARNVSTTDIRNAIEAQNMEVSAGTIGAPGDGSVATNQYTLTAKGELSDADEFGNIIIRTDDTGILRLRDVAKVELGSKSYSAVARLNGKEMAVIGVSQLPGANAIDVANGAIAELNRLSKYFPNGVSYRVINNTTDYVKASIDNVVVTFVETTLIVMIVILIFLQNWRAVIIPMITIPVSLIATFAVMKMLGFSLNTLSLFGLVLAIAIVVDDAIVVVENCARLVDSGKLSRREAARQAMKELTGPVVGEVLVLLSVFIPTAFVSGITGALYKQFALTIAISTAFSGFTALTLTPALCALMLNPRKPSRFILYRMFNYGFNGSLSLYDRLISRLLAHPRLVMASFIVVALASIWGFSKLPTSYIPEEDMGYFMTSIQLPTGASLERTEKVVNALVAEIKDDVPEVKDVMSVAGFSFMAGGSGSNLGSLFVMLKPWKERGTNGSIDKVLAKVNEIAARQQEAIIFSLNPPAIPGLGISSGLQLQLLDINNLGADEIMKAISELQMQGAKNDKFASITTMYQGEVPQYTLNLNRDKANLMGVDIENVYSALSDFLGGGYINNFIKFGRNFQVTMQAEGKSRQQINDILNISIPNSNGEMVPLSAILTPQLTMGVPSVNRYNMYTTAAITATPANGVSTSEAIAEMEQLVNTSLSNNFSYAWTGIAYQETKASTTISFVLIFAIIMTILVLAAQYESWTDPLAVILVMPIAILGIVIGSLIMHLSISIYSQIGLILLLGMSAKNAILIVEFASDFRKKGLPIIQAAHDAGVIRFRPIMMTALAFIFGVMPMMFSSGAGANSRIQLATAIVFGMAVNALIGTLLIPNFWLIMQQIQERYLSHLFPERR